MFYCHNCGTQLQDDDLFCPNCGTKQNQQPKMNFNVNLKSIKPEAVFRTVIDMLLKPVTAAKKFVNESEKSDTIVMTVFLLIVQGIMGIWKASQIVGNIKDFIEGLVKGLATALDKIVPGTSSGLSDSAEMFSEITKYKSLVKMPYGKIFFQNCAIFIIGVAAIFAIIYLGIVISKKKAEVFPIYKTALIVSVPVLYFELFSLLVSYASLQLGLVLIIIGWLISAGCLTVVTKEVLFVDENYSLYFAVVSSVISLVIMALVMKSFVTSDILSIIKSFQSSLNSIMK